MKNIIIFLLILGIFILIYLNNIEDFRSRRKRRKARRKRIKKRRSRRRSRRKRRRKDNCKGKIGRALTNCRNRRTNRRNRERENKAKLAKKQKKERDNMFVYLKHFIDTVFVNKRLVPIEISEKIMKKIERKNNNLKYGKNSMLIDRINLRVINNNCIMTINSFFPPHHYLDIFDGYNIKEGDVVLKIQDLDVYGSNISSKDTLAKLLQNYLNLDEDNSFRLTVISRPNYNNLSGLNKNIDETNFMFTPSKNNKGEILDDYKYTHIHEHIHK